MADKTIGNGILLKYDENGDGLSHSTIGEIINVTPPTKTREDIDVTTTDSLFDTMVPSIPNYGELSFDQVWDPNDTNHELIETGFNNAVAASAYEWQIVYPVIAAAVTDEFTGYVKSIGPQSIGPKDSIKRTVVVTLTSAITRT